MPRRSEVCQQETDKQGQNNAKGTPRPTTESRRRTSARTSKNESRENKPRNCKHHHQETDEESLRSRGKRGALEISSAASGALANIGILYRMKTGSNVD